jgi:hypothetical protein
MRESFLFLFRRYFDKNRFDILVEHKTVIIGIQVYLGTTNVEYPKNLLERQFFFLLTQNKIFKFFLKMKLNLIK